MLSTMYDQVASTQYGPVSGTGQDVSGYDPVVTNIADEMRQATEAARADTEGFDADLKPTHLSLFNQIAKQQNARLKLDDVGAAAAQGFSPDQFVARQKAAAFSAGIQPRMQAIVEKYAGDIEKMGDEQMAQLQTRLQELSMPEAPEMQQPGFTDAQAITTIIASLFGGNAGNNAAKGFLGANQQRVEADYRNQSVKYQRLMQIYSQERENLYQQHDAAVKRGDTRAKLYLESELKALDMEMDALTKAAGDEADLEKAKIGAESRYTIAEFNAMQKAALQNDAQEFKAPLQDSQINKNNAGADLTKAKATTENEMRPGKVAKLQAEGRYLEARTAVAKAVETLTQMKAEYLPKDFGLKVQRLEQSRQAHNDKIALALQKIREGKSTSDSDIKSHIAMMDNVRKLVTSAQTAKNAALKAGDKTAADAAQETIDFYDGKFKAYEKTLNQLLAAKAQSVDPNAPAVPTLTGKITPWGTERNKG